MKVDAYKSTDGRLHATERAAVAANEVIKKFDLMHEVKKALGEIDLGEVEGDWNREHERIEGQNKHVDLLVAAICDPSSNFDLLGIVTRAAHKMQHKG